MDNRVAATEFHGSRPRRYNRLDVVLFITLMLLVLLVFGFTTGGR